MINWINTHGFIALGFCFAFACIISCAPPLPEGCGFWTTWLYKVMQMAGASLDKVVHNSPYGPKFDSIKQTATLTQSDKGTTKTLETVVESPKL